MFERLRGGVAGETGLVFAGTLTSGLLGFAGTLLAIRVLGPAQFGQLALLTAVMTLLAQFLDFGLSTTFVKYTSQRLKTDPARAELTLHVTFVIKVALSAALLVAGAVLAGPVAGLFFPDKDMALLLFLAIAGAVGTILWEFCRGYFQATQRFLHMAAVVPARNLFRLLLLGILFWLNLMDLENVVLATVAAPFVGFVIGWIMIPHGFIRATGDRKGALSELYRFTRWVTISSLATMFIMRIDIFMLEAISTSVQVGYYASANQLAYLFPLITGSITTVLLPRVSQYKGGEELRGYVRKVFRVTPPVLLIFVPLVIAAPFLVPFLMGADYLHSVPVFRLLIVSFTISVIANPIALTFYNLDRADILAYLNLIQLAVNVLFNLWLIPKYGAVGAAIGTLFVRVVGGVYIGLFVLRLLYSGGIRGEGEA